MKIFRDLSALLLALIGATAAAAAEDSWTLESGAIDPAHYSGVSVANGEIGMVSAPVPFQTTVTMLNGAYEPREPGAVDGMLRTFNFLELALSLDGVRIERLAQTQGFHQTLDMKRAALTTSFEYQSKATITYTLRALRNLPYTALLDVSIVAKVPITITARGSIEGAVPPYADSAVDAAIPLDHPGHFENQIDTGGTASRVILLTAASGKGPTGRLTLAAAQTFMFDDTTGAAPAVTPQAGGTTFTRPVAAGEHLHFGLVGATMSSAHSADPVNETQRLAAMASLQGTAQLIAQHERAWAALWKSDIRVNGDEPTQRDVHSMLYHLYSFIREGSGRSISPMGLSRNVDGYLGHVFWDAETWMLPPLLALHPELARTMLEYRYDRLPAARQNAVANGYRGALFPWESAQSGGEDTPLCCLATEIHITADIGNTAWNYYRVTRDRQWLRERGYPLLEATAEFWASRVSRNGPGHYDITHVVAADEYSGDVDNNAFTNAAARQNLAAAVAAAKILGLKPHPDWNLVRRNIPILHFADGVTREFATYKGEKVKQADVNLLAYPLHEITDLQAIRRDLDYYAPRVDIAEGPAMTQSVFSILYERLGMPERAYECFRAGFEPNKRAPFGTLAEAANSGNPYFATGAGGELQALLYGFGGLDITDQGLVQRASQLPARWVSLTLTGIGPAGRTYRVAGLGH